MNLKIEKIIYTGKSLARHEGKVIFTDQGLPGEVVEVKDIKDKKNFSEGVTECVMEPSPDRVLPKCGHYKICSPYQYMNYERQLAVKKEQLSEMLSHDLKIKDIDIHVRPSEKIWGYRNKLHLHIMWAGPAPYYSYHEPESPTKFEAIGECHLASPEVNNLLKDVISIIHRSNLMPLAELTVREAGDGSILLGFSGERIARPESKLKEICELKAKYKLAGVVYEDKESAKVHIVDGKKCLEENLEGKKLSFGLESFFQVNTVMISKVLKDIRALGLGKTHEFIDMFTGVGTFGLLLSGDFANIKACEIAHDNLTYLKKNIVENSVKNMRVYEGASENVCEVMLKTKNSVVFVDPPRKGLEKSLVDAIMKAEPAKIIYLSCNPSTLMRDLKIFQKGFKIEQVFMYDFFPQTVHIESMVVLGK